MTIHGHQIAHAQSGYLAPSGEMGGIVLNKDARNDDDVLKK